MNNFDVIIIGSGIGGLISAGILTSRGIKDTVGRETAKLQVDTLLHSKEMVLLLMLRWIVYQVWLLVS